MLHAAYRFYYNHQRLNRDTVFKTLKYLLMLRFLVLSSRKFPNLVASGMHTMR
jgi:hypothetical protein